MGLLLELRITSHLKEWWRWKKRKRLSLITHLKIQIISENQMMNSIKNMKNLKSWETVGQPLLKSVETNRTVNATRVKLCKTAMKKKKNQVKLNLT